MLKALSITLVAAAMFELSSGKLRAFLEYLKARLEVKFRTSCFVERVVISFCSDANLFARRLSLRNVNYANHF